MKFVFSIVIGFLLVGCQSTTKHVVLPDSDPVLKKVEQIATTIANNSATLNDLEAARYREMNGHSLSTSDLSELPYLRKVESLGGEYHGPVEPFLVRLSKQAGMNPPRVLNLRPSADVLISIDTDYRPVVDMMRDVGVQTGTRAKITYKAQENLFELEYTTF